MVGCPESGGVSVNPRVVVSLAGAVSLAAAMAAGFEGNVPTPYRDVTGVLTVCYGHTGSVEQRRYTDAECQALLQKDMAEANATVRRCVGRDMPVNVEAALTDLTYNVGPGRVARGRDRGHDGFCVLKNGRPSTIRTFAMLGDWQNVCDQFKYWGFGGGNQLPGLVKRRAAEQAMCEART